MNCKYFRKYILDLDYKNGHGLSKEIAQHLKMCEECRIFYRDMERTWRWLDGMPEIIPSNSFNAKVWQKIDEKRKSTLKEVFTLAFFPLPLKILTISVVVIIFLASGYIAFYATSHTTRIKQITFTKRDIQDNEMLMELDALVNLDESEYLSTCGKWMPEQKRVKKKESKSDKKHKTKSESNKNSININTEKLNL